jgi:hypothetical protein
MGHTFATPIPLVWASQCQLSQVAVSNGNAEIRCCTDAPRLTALRWTAAALSSRMSRRTVAIVDRPYFDHQLPAFPTMTRTGGVVVLFTGALLAGFVFAQKQEQNDAVAPSDPLRIFIDQPLSEATAVLEARQIEFAEGGFAFTRGDPDRSNLIFTLDENNTYVCAFFSQSRQSITGLSMVFFPSRAAHSKLTQSFVSATELTLHPDNSYTVHFSVPLTLERDQKLESSYPPLPSDGDSTGESQDR